MKKMLLVLLIVTTGFGAVGQKEPFITRSFKGESINQTSVKTSGGSIAVTGIESGEARVEVYITPGNSRNQLSKEEIQKRLDEKYELEIAVSNGKLVAIAKKKDKLMDWKKSLSISFKVYVPKKMSTDLSTSGGSISLADLSGTHVFTTSGGNLEIDKVSGNIKGRTSGGSINVKNCRDEIELSTSGGSIEASNCEGRIQLGTSGGSLVLKDLKGEIKATTSGGSVDGNNIGGELIARTSGGSIHFDDLSCSLETSTSGGNIHVSMKELGKYLTISNSSGNIDISMPKNKGVDLKLKANKIRTDRFENFSGDVSDDEIDGKLNGGGIPVKIKSSSGQIQLAFR